MNYKIHEDEHKKILTSSGYNYAFNKENGFFCRWGKTADDDPDYSPFGPELIDIEISTVCHGPTGKPCAFCYKANGPKGGYMNLTTFRKVLGNLPDTVTQVAFGIGDIDGNPDLFNIMLAAREAGIIPNVTINGARCTDDHYDRLVELCGAVAVSRYDPSGVCYEAVEQLSRRGLQQVNIHQLLSEESFDDCLEVLHDATTDRRLRGLNAVVFLLAKPQGRGGCRTPVRSTFKYQQLIAKAQELGVPIGFDSCSAPAFLKAVRGHPQEKIWNTLAEPCEAGVFSLYINTDGRAYPCSFCEEGPGIDLTVDFLNSVWYSTELKDWRARLLGNNRHCPRFELG